MHQNESQQLFRTNSIEEIKASYFKLKVTLLSYTNSNYSTLSIFTPSNSNPLLSCFYVNGSNPISSFIEFSCIAYFPKKKSIVMVGKDLSTCLLKLSTDSFITLKTSIVPSTSKHLLPIIIIRVPKYIQALSSKSRLKVEGRLKSIFSNQRDYLEFLELCIWLVTFFISSSQSVKKWFFSYSSVCFRLNKQLGQLSYCFYVFYNSDYNSFILSYSFAIRFLFDSFTVFDLLQLLFILSFLHIP